MFEPEMNMREELRELLAVLQKAEEGTSVAQLEAALKGTDDEYRSFLTSNELWGGAGSIADQAGILDTSTDLRKSIESTLIRLGEKQLQANIVNPRTAMRVEAFKTWRG